MEDIRRRKNFKSKTIILLKKNSFKEGKYYKESLKNNNKEEFKNVIIQNNNNSNNNENNSESLEMLIKEELEKAKLSLQKKENLKNIDLIEKNVSDLYKWQALFNRSIPLRKYVSPKSNLNKKENNKEKDILYIINALKQNKSIQEDNSSKIINNDNKRNKNNFNNIDYSKGINVISQLPNESLNNYYEKIIQKRKEAPELGPRLKLKNRNLQTGIKTQRILAFNKEIKLNILLTNEIENDNFSNEDLIIVAKRKNADILIKPYQENEDNKSKNFKTMKSYSSNEYKANMLSEKNNKNKKGLILSLYDENNPYIKKFNEHVYSLSEQTNNKNTEKEEVEVIKPTLKRNIFSASDLNLKSLEINYENEKINNYQNSGRNKSSINEIKRKSIPLITNYYKNEISKKDKNSMAKLNESNNIKSLKRPMSSSNLDTKIYQKFGLISLHFNEKEGQSSQEEKPINYITSFRKKISSKVGNIIYDKMNKIIKSKAKKNKKIILGNYPQNYIIDKNIKGNKKAIKLVSKKVSTHHYENSEESKNNKIIPTFKYDDLKNQLNTNKLLSDDEYENKFDYNFFEDDYKYENLKNKIKIYDIKSISKNKKKEIYKYYLSIHNKLGNLYYSCSNNQIINNKRKMKNKFLNEFDDEHPFKLIKSNFSNIVKLMKY